MARDERQTAQRSDETVEQAGQSSRRGVLTAGAGIATTGLLAGCLGSSKSGESNESYTVSIEPAGEVEFESVPESWANYNGAWADMAVALGHSDGVTALDSMAPSLFYDELPGVSLDYDVPELSTDGFDKELFYELDSDVHLVDPNLILHFDDNWDQSDIDEIAEQVGPFFGSNSRRKRDFHDYRFYSLEECFEASAELFQERERYEQLSELRSNVIADAQERVPPEAARPEIALLNGGSEPANDRLYLLNLQGEGYEMQTYRDLGVKNAFDPDQTGWEDYEPLIEADPDAIIIHWGIEEYSKGTFESTFVEPMQADQTANEIEAVREGRIYPGAYGEQGPIINLFQTELTAKTVYPETFGEWQDVGDIPESQQLFDRQRVAEIVTGDTE